MRHPAGRRKRKKIALERAKEVISRYCLGPGYYMTKTILYFKSEYAHEVVADLSRNNAWGGTDGNSVKARARRQAEADIREALK